MPAGVSPTTLRAQEERAAEAEASVLDGTPVPDAPGPAVAVARAAADRGAQARQLTPAEYDRLVRTVAGEAFLDGAPGMQAVTHVILNRLATGRWGETVDSVVLAPRQFEPWNRWPVVHPIRPAGRRAFSTRRSCKSAAGRGPRSWTGPAGRSAGTGSGMHPARR